MSPYVGVSLVGTFWVGTRPIPTYYGYHGKLGRPGKITFGTYLIFNAGFAES